MKVILIAHMSRSGSTLLTRLLAEASDALTVLPENRLAEAFAAFGGFRAGGLAPDRALELIQDDVQAATLRLTNEERSALKTAMLAGASAAEALAEVVGRRHNVRPSALCFKHPSNIAVAERVLTETEDGQVIYIVRDGRAMLHSMKSVEHPYFPGEKLGEGNAWMIGRRWRRYGLRIEALATAHPGRVAVVRYEDLVARPDDEIDRLLEAMELARTESGGAAPGVAAAEATLHRKVASPPNTDSIDLWRRKLRLSQIAGFEAGAGERLTHYGYDPSAARTRTGLALRAAIGLQRLAAPFFWARVRARRGFRLLGKPVKIWRKLRTIASREART